MSEHILVEDVLHQYLMATIKWPQIRSGVNNAILSFCFNNNVSINDILNVSLDKEHVMIVNRALVSAHKTYGIRADFHLDIVKKDWEKSKDVLSFTYKTWLLLGYDLSTLFESADKVHRILDTYNAESKHYKYLLSKCVDKVNVDKYLIDIAERTILRLDGICSCQGLILLGDFYKHLLDASLLLESHRLCEKK